MSDHADKCGISLELSQEKGRLQLDGGIGIISAAFALGVWFHRVAECIQHRGTLFFVSTSINVSVFAGSLL
jgi:hypothetical protein